MPIFMPKGAPKGGTNFAWALPDFDQIAFEHSEAGCNIAAMQALYRDYPNDEMNPSVLQFWMEHGLKKEIFDADNDGKYAVFTPYDLDKTKKYALVYDSHGGMEPINKTETNGFPLLAGKEKFICVCPWNRGPSNDEVESEFPRILNDMFKAGYPIDESRIYAVGYSGGSDATGVLACAYPKRIAAISPDPGGNLFAKGRWYIEPDYYQRNLPYQMPMICVGGTMDGGDRYPLMTEEAMQNFNIWMQKIVKVYNYQPSTLAESQTLAQATTDPVKKAFGFDFHRTYTLQMEGLEWYCGEFFDQTGNVAARFITAVGLPHAQTKYHAPIIWDYLKHFSRNPVTGESIYTRIVIDGIR